MMKYHAIAIDGPSGAGKSTVAKELSGILKFIYIDTGAMYRAIGLYTSKVGVEANDRQRLPELLPHIHLELGFIDGVQHIFLNGEDVSTQIRLPEMSMYASAVSAIPEVRTFLLEMQRQMARRTSVIMDGRDIGTVVLPDAQVKIFLTAAPEIRAQRRMKELERRGTPEPFEKVLEEMKQRDYNDSHRAAAPLKQAEDAVLVDTTELDFAGSEDALLRLVEEKLGVKACK